MIPDKYLNTNVRAMLDGGIKEEEPPVPEKHYILRLDKLFSFLKKSYRLEVSIIKEES
jgi:hypothetical protein|tara:strand:- start:2943 stop:3116 length:174 start_codon:yes stop_codon:yes gene_type:complete